MLINKKNINTKNDKPQSCLHEKSSSLAGALSGILKSKERYILLGDYPDLPHSFNGNDIDVLVTDIKVAKKEFQKYGFIFRQQSKYELRAFIYVMSSRKWIAVDIETIYAYSGSERKLLKNILTNPVKDKDTGLLTSPKVEMLAYKTMKYIFNGYVHSWYQIRNLHKSWNALRECERGVALELLSGLGLNNKDSSLVDLVISSEKKFLSDGRLQAHIDNKRNSRHSKRLVYQGRLNRKVILSSPILLWRLAYGRFIKSRNALPAIALVGNDGSGKTEQCQRMKDELYKLDPLHIVMRGNGAWLPGWGKFRNIILSYIKRKKKTGKKSNGLLIWGLAWVGEIGDFLDRWYRYQVGMAWANAGFGFVMFERYPTDRLRGEYPGPKWSLFPVEQYFPMPDLIILLDVDEDDSLKRKPNDGHSYQEMHEKRENYLKLIQEIKPSMVVDSKACLNDIQKQISETIWKYSVIKQQKDQNSVGLPARWIPGNKGKSLAGRNKQKEGFL